MFISKTASHLGHYAGYSLQLWYFASRSASVEATRLLSDVVVADLICLLQQVFYSNSTTKCLAFSDRIDRLRNDEGKLRLLLFVSQSVYFTMTFDIW